MIAQRGLIDAQRDGRRIPPLAGRSATSLEWLHRRRDRRPVVRRRV